MLFRKLLSYQKPETSIKISLKGASKGELWTHGGDFRNQIYVM